MAVVGAGINGLLTAFLITQKYNDLHLDIYDAEEHPNSKINHRSVTHGSRDARQITGSESIGFENSIHKNALRNVIDHKTPGWLLKDETRLTANEKEWRERFEGSYIGLDTLNELDFAHAQLNYRGLKEWEELTKLYPFIKKHIITHKTVDVYFQNKADFENDLEMETEFRARYFDGLAIREAANQEFASLYTKKIVVPGMSIRVKSLAVDLLNRLEANKNVRFYWESSIGSADELAGEVIIWTSGVTHEQPVEYQDHYVQGIVGCWVTIANQGYKHPFKIATPAPSAYLNFTPDVSQLHISGGFGWTGEYIDNRLIRELAGPVGVHFVDQVNKYLRANISINDIDYCVRPSTPTGLPLLLTTKSGGKTNIFITGSAKSGTTHAPVLSDYVLEQIKFSELTTS